MDLSQSGAITLGLALLAEYVPVFPARDWGIGGDEWMMGADASSFPALLTAAQTQFGGSATIRDLEYYFYNQMAAYLTGQGRTPHIYDDQLVTPWNIVTPSTSIIIDVWYGNTAPATLKTDGYTLVNSNSNYLYAYTNTNSYPTAGSLAGFTDDEFADGGSGEQTLTGIFGVQLSAWSVAGDTYTEAQVAAGLYPAMAALANQLGAIPPVLAAAAAFPAPAIHAGTGVTPGALGGSVSFPAPAVTAATSATATPTALATTAAFTVPALHCDETITPAVLAASSTFPAPGFSDGESITPAVLAASVSFPAAVFQSGAGITVTPAALTSGPAFLTPAFRCDQTLTATVLRTAVIFAAIIGTLHNPHPAMTGTVTVGGLTGTATISGLTGKTE
jgi:hypothetical protein